MVQECIQASSSPWVLDTRAALAVPVALTSATGNWPIGPVQMLLAKWCGFSDTLVVSSAAHGIRSVASAPEASGQTGRPQHALTACCKRLISAALTARRCCSAAPHWDQPAGVAQYCPDTLPAVLNMQGALSFWASADLALLH